VEHKEFSYVNIALGAWLFVSAFLWHHNHAQFTSALVVAMIAVLGATVSLVEDSFRFVTTVAAAWLVVGGFVLPRASTGTMWNDVLVGVVLFFFSLAGPTSRHVSPGAPRHA